eukprot:gb/GEZJ01000558.1/.p1 GENE.gb/GEZJ01000558.1/~~gb/GEZJ01000558.1/.p1  ORF type:complete len:1155 (-),score=196.96 gb/GEZJ01000558.1/:2949-6413(-)
MQRHPSGCDPQAFRGHHSIPAPTRNARPPSSLDPVLETLPGMQIALGELERSGPSLFRGTIEKTNLNRLANDLTEILVRHVNRLRLHAKIVAQTPHKQDTPNLDEIITPRKRTRPLRYCEESESPTNRYHVSERRSNHYHIDRDTQTFPRTRSLSTRIENRRSHRKRRLTRFAALEENSDDDDVREVHHVQRPRRSKEIRHNLSDDLAYEIMEQSARRKEEQQKRHREIIQAEKEAAVVVEESSDEDDDEGFVPKVVCPKLYVRERALQSDFASLTPMITDPDDDTDTELFRKWNARRTRKIVHDDITDEQPVQKQSDIFPFGRKTRLLRDVIVDVDLMKKLAREGLHHKSVGSILYTLPAIPRHYLDTGGRHWTDFDITEGFRKAPSKTPFVRSMFKRPITATKPDAVMNNATARDKLSAMREQASHKPSAKASLPLPEHTPVLKEPNPLIQATNVDTGVSTRPVQAHAQDHTDIASSRKLEELYQALLKQVEQVPTQTNLPDDGMMKSKSIDPADMERALDIRKTRAHHPLSSRTIPAMRQAVGLHANQAEQHSSTGIMQRTQKPQSQVSTDPIVLQRPQTNAYQHDHGMQLNPLFALGSNQGGTSQLHPQQLQKQVQPILEHQQESVSAPIPAEQRNVSPAGSQMLASNEVLQVFQDMLQHGLVSARQSSEHPLTQSILDLQRQPRTQSLQQQMIQHQNLRQQQLQQQIHEQQIRQQIQQQQTQQKQIRQQQLRQQQLQRQQLLHQQLQHQPLQQHQLLQQQHQQQQEQQRQLQQRRLRQKRIQQLQQLQQQRFQQEELRQRELQQAQLHQAQLQQAQLQQAQLQQVQLQQVQLQQEQLQQAQLQQAQLQQAQLQQAQLQQTQLQQAQPQQPQLQQPQLLEQQQLQHQQLLLQKAGHHLNPNTQNFAQVNQQVGQEQVARQYESQATPLSEHHDQPQRLPSDGNHKKKGYQAEMRTANGIVSSKAPLHSSAVEKKGTQPLLPCTQTGSSTEHEGNGRQVAQTPSHPSSGIKTSSMNGPKFPLQTDADVKTVTNEPRAHLVATSETTPEVQLGSTQPSRIPNSTGKGVQGWSWKRQDCVTEQPNGHGAVPSEHPESRTTTHDQTQAPLGHDTARDDQRRRYEEDYRAAYELQLRKVMEEIRKKNENGDPGLE